MDDFLGVTLALLTVLTILVALVVRATKYWIRYADTQYRRVTLAAAAPKAGDIIFSIAHVHSLSTSVFACNFFSHCGIVVEDVDGGLQLSETSPEVGHETLQSLAAQLQNCKGTNFLMRLATPLTADQKAVLRRHATTPVQYPTLMTALGALVGLRSARLHCMQHVATALNSLGLTDLAGNAIDDSFFGSPNALSELRKMRGNEYHEPVELIH